MPVAIDVIKRLGSYIGFEDILPAGETACSVIFDDKIIVSFIVSDPDMINAISVLGSLNSENEQVVMKDALGRNFQPRKGSQFTFSIDANTDALVLTSRWDARGLETDAFYKDIEAFVETVEECQGFLESGYKERLSKQDAVPRETPGNHIRG